MRVRRKIKTYIIANSHCCLPLHYAGWQANRHKRILQTAGLTQNDRDDTESKVLARRRLIKLAKPQTTEGALSSIIEGLGDEIWNRGTWRKLAGGVDPPERAKCRELGRCPWSAENPWGEEPWNRWALVADCRRGRRGAVDPGTGGRTVREDEKLRVTRKGKTKLKKINKHKPGSNFVS